MIVTHFTSSLKKVKSSSTKSSKSPTPTSPAMILATEFQSSLGTEFPSCVKLMGRSQVTQGFWMVIPLSLTNEQYDNN